MARSTQQPTALAERAKALIDQSFATDTTLSQIASTLGSSAAQISRAFKADYGIPPVQYRNRLRVSAAEFLLLQGSSPIATVAADVGFADLGRFYKAVKQTTLVTPGGFKKES